MVDTEYIQTAMEFDPEKVAQGQEYARVKRRWMLVELILFLVLILAFWLSGASVILKQLLIDLGVQSKPALVAAYIALCTLGAALISLPLDWWVGYVLPHRYDLSTETLTGWMGDLLKSLILSLVLGIPVAEVVYWLLGTLGAIWWVWAAAFVILFDVVLGMLSPVLLVPLFFKLTPLEDSALVARIKQLGERTHTQVAEVYTIDLSRRTKAANAMVMGLGRTKRIALGDTLSADYSADEIEGILAHELGHQVHHDLELGLVVQSALTFGGMYVAHRFLAWGIVRFDFQGLDDVAALPLFVLAIALFSLFSAPLSNAYSRWRERLADAFAVQTIDNSQSFANALVKLGNQNLSDPEPPAWVVWLMYSHPPLKARVEAVRNL
ncbi:MAG: M48 family metallopeptidase [Anaerolineae bacterium]|nr:M48 family metallopeptidase [Anaerolineae bacterium]